jgi:hypothetical protein
LIVLGIILLIIGFIANIAIIWTIGIIVLVIGVILALLGMTGHAVRGRRHYFLACRSQLVMLRSRAARHPGLGGDTTRRQAWHLSAPLDEMCDKLVTALASTLISPTQYESRNSSRPAVLARAGASVRPAAADTMAAVRTHGGSASAGADLGRNRAGVCEVVRP